MNTEQLYFSSPVFFQNMMVSAYGAILAHQRYGGKHRRYVSDLKHSQWLAPNLILKLQESLFLKYVAHAFTSVPFYRDWSQRTGIGINDITSLSDIAKLPIIEKDRLREDPIRFCSEKYLSKKSTFWLDTSGTTGKPIRILCDNDSRRKHYAFWTRFREWHGIRPQTKRVTLFGRIIAAADQNRPPFWRYDFLGKNVLFSSYHLSESNLPYYYKKLVSINPEEIIGYPSSVFMIAKYVRRIGLRGIRPKCVITTAETLLPQQRDTIEDAFDCKVVDQYGCTEMAFFISQCEHGTYHVHPEHGFVEVLDKKGQPVKIGEPGEMVCTGFVNMAMPLLRYRIGDQVALSLHKCNCGRAFQTVNEIVGRVDDILYTPDGRPLGRLDPVFKGLSGIYETQIIQRDRLSLEIKMVVASNFTNRHMKEFMYELRKRTGNQMKIEIALVHEIPKDSNGKFRTVISMIRSTDF